MALKGENVLLGPGIKALARIRDGSTPSAGLTLACSSFTAQEKSAEICFSRKLAASASARISLSLRTLAFDMPATEACQVGALLFLRQR